MAELVHHNVADDGLGRHHAFPVEGQLATMRAGGPIISEFRHIDPAWSNIDFRGELPHALANALKSTRDVVVSERGVRCDNLATLDELAAKAKLAIF
jgi:hypothetical protein